MFEKCKVTRRSVLGSSAAVASVASIAVKAQSAPKTYVLVHGTWHGGWCWRRVVDRLSERGHKVYAPTLTGVGERSHLLNDNIGLNTHIADVVNLIKWERLQDFVLVGHSSGGIVVTGVAELVTSAINSIVFVDGFLPEDNTSIADALPEAARAPILAALQRGETSVKPIPAAAFKVNEKDIEWVNSMCTPHPIRTMVDKIRTTGAGERIAKKAYVRNTDYTNGPFDAQQAKIQNNPSWRKYTVKKSGHDTMIDAPDQLTDILLEVA
jgi:pimeloyl-ACP methyl ester carboxylesterase